MEHNPRLLLTLTHDSPNFFIGELDKYIKLKSEKRDEELRNVTDFSLDMGSLRARIDSLEQKPQVEIYNHDPLLVLEAW